MTTVRNIFIQIIENQNKFQEIVEKPMKRRIAATTSVSLRDEEALRLTRRKRCAPSALRLRAVLGLRDAN
jgi:hypothetical protein